MQLSELIERMLIEHPGLEVSTVGHATYADRYVSPAGVPIGHEKRNKTFQKLWVRADSVRRTGLVGLNWKFWTCATFEESKPNHDLFAEPGFKDADLIEVKVTDLWSAVRVIVEAVGASPT